MAMFQYNSYKLPALVIIPENGYNYSVISVDEANGFAILIIANRAGHIVQNSGYVYTLGDIADNQFGHYSFITALTAGDVDNVNKIFGQNDINEYSWKQLYLLESDRAILAGAPVWSNINLQNSKGQTILEASIPEKVEKKPFSKWEFLEGFLIGVLGAPISLWNNYQYTGLQLLDGNFEEYPYLILGGLKDQLLGNYGALIASKKPFFVYEDNVINIYENAEVQGVFTDFKTWLQIEDKYWMDDTFQLGHIVGKLNRVIWSNYNLINEQGNIVFKGRDSFPKFF